MDRRLTGKHSGPVVRSRLGLQLVVAQSQAISSRQFGSGILVLGSGLPHYRDLRFCMPKAALMWAGMEIGHER
jgi:hypothetical protein